MTDLSRTGSPNGARLGERSDGGGSDGDAPEDWVKASWWSEPTGEVGPNESTSPGLPPVGAAATGRHATEPPAEAPLTAPVPVQEGPDPGGRTPAGSNAVPTPPGMALPAVVHPQVSHGPANPQPAHWQPPDRYPPTHHPDYQHPRPAAQHPAAQHPAAQYPVGQYPVGQHPVAQHPAAQFPGAQHPAAQYPGAPYPAGPYPAGPYPAAPLPPPPLPRHTDAVATPLGHRSIVRYDGDAPIDGWRGRVYTATGGRVNPGLSPAQVARQQMIHAIRRPLRGSHRVTVMSVKGGVGKTTVAACLGLVLAENRGDRVVALDANPDAGTLAERLTGDIGVTVRDLLDNIEDPRSLVDVDRFTSLAGRLQVLASEQDPGAGESFNRDEYERVCAVLARFANIVVTDSGTGLVHSAMEGTLALADSLVVVGAPTVDGAGRAAKTLDWLASHGHAEQAARALVVLSCDRWSPEVDRGRIRAHFEARCRGVVEIPFDPHLAIGGRVLLPALRPATIDAFLLLAARVADGFVGTVRA